MRYAHIENEKNLKITIQRLPFSDRTNSIMPNGNKTKQNIFRSPRNPVPNKKYEKNLKINIQRLPFSDRTNSIMPNGNKTKVSIFRRSPRKPVPNKKYENEEIFQKTNVTVPLKSVKPAKKRDPVLQIVLERCHNENLGKINSDQQENPNIIRQSTPLVGRLRKCENKDYLESTLEESPVKNVQTKTATKLPIYSQKIPVEPKVNPQDPYAFDIIDSDKEKKNKKKKKHNESAKFNKTMFDILYKIEKKENKTARKKVKVKKFVKKSPVKYQDNIKKVMNRVLSKVQEKKLVTKNAEYSRQHKIKKSTEILPITNITQRKDIEKIQKSTELLQITNITQRKAIEETQKAPVIEKSVFKDTIGHSLQEDFLGFERIPPNDSTLRSNVLNESSFNNNLSKPSTSSLQNISVTNNAEIDYHVTPTRNKSRINILSNIYLGNTNSILSKTSFPADLINKSLNLHREFHSNSLILNNQSVLCDKTVHSDDHFETDDYVDESELEDEDDYFGFRESTGNTPVNVDLRRRGQFNNTKQPWRFQGYTRRAPQILQFKKNGLICKQQEMFIDYEFVKRIEALSANNVNKRPEPAPPKPPIQTTLLDFIETNQEHPDEPTQLSLFDYEEFSGPKQPRRILGVIQDNQIVSTPKKGIQNFIASPNVSIIHTNENNENRTYRSYKKKCIEEKSDEKEDENKIDKKKCIEEKSDEKEDENKIEEELPSILEKDCEVDDAADLHLFEDTEGDKDVDFSIKLPKMKYQRARKRHISEGNDDGEKKPKKKKKNMMTKTEEAAFEDWAAKTNARFEEEDKFELTIE